MRVEAADMLQELRYSVCSLRSRPGFTATVVLTLALGIGANAAVFDVLDRLLFRPPAHVHDADRVARLHITQTYGPGRSFTGAVTSYSVYRDLREHTHTFSALAAFYEGELSVGQGPEAERARGALVSYSYFPLLGVTPALGRFFEAEEDRVGGEPVAVLSYGYWQRRFGGDAGVVGRQVRVGPDGYTVGRGGSQSVYRGEPGKCGSLAPDRARELARFRSQSCPVGTRLVLGSNHRAPTQGSLVGNGQVGRDNCASEREG